MKPNVVNEAASEEIEMDIMDAKLGNELNELSKLFEQHFQIKQLSENFIKSI